ncbi:uncharacterized protein LOC117141911 [Drosophila mauritiana]|uniref:Uncharacterized protein LOC117141911 n=1 Tax=Drosophila mauritiana TaxID=7226 RepID=A0A6P8JX74_DROMA|nr:uncharacterized protein LOC117141911 [Drosophila mauritiana]
MDISVPPPDSHWSLRFVDIEKPFPKKTLANATYKIIRFFYPPFALEAVDVTHVVSDPELNSLNVVLCVVVPLMLACIGYAVYNYVRNEHTVAKRPPLKLYELEQRMKEKYGPEYKQGIWKRKDIADPLLLTNNPSESKAKFRESSNDHWLPKPIDDFNKTIRSDDEISTQLNRHSDLAGNFWKGEVVESSFSTQFNRHSDLAGNFRNQPGFVPF